MPLEDWSKLTAREGANADRLAGLRYHHKRAEKAHRDGVTPSSKREHQDRGEKYRKQADALGAKLKKVKR